MFRLLDWPRGLIPTSKEPLSGPRSINAGTSQSITGYVQTFSSSFGLWKFQFGFPPMRRDEFRRYRGLVTALHGGVNAVRVPMCDPDGLSFSDIGISGATINGVPWSNNMPWSNGQNWKPSRPKVALAQAANKGDDIIVLSNQYWANVLDMGDWIGFAPFHYGLYTVTEKIAARTFRIWPPLRKALTTENYATLDPVLVMRLEGESGASAGRGLHFAENAAMTLVEVEDSHVRNFFTN